MSRHYLVLPPLLALAACAPDYQPRLEQAEGPKTDAPTGGTETAIFAGGCFWCTEADFEKLPGITDAVSGYTGGTTANPTYEQVSSNGTGHYEAVRVTYDPAQISYPQLVDYYFRTVDPTDAGGQFCDRGESYRTAIFVVDEEQRKAAEAEKAEADRQLSGKVVTPILAASEFYEAEGYHQDYYKENSLKYKYYRTRCGRDARLEEVWGS